jgi:hypothetical protein
MYFSLYLHEKYYFETYLIAPVYSTEQTTVALTLAIKSAKY